MINVMMFRLQAMFSALKDQSDCKVALILVDGWKSATSMSGAVYVVVILHGDLLMPRLHADS